MQAGLGPIAVSLGVAPAQIVVEQELEKQWALQQEAAEAAQAADTEEAQ